MNLRHALLQTILWKKQYFANYFLLIFCCALYYYLSPLRHPVVDAGSLIVSFIFCCAGFRQDNYSWKYFQALPLTKRELFHYFILNQFQTLFPILVWVFTFFAYVMEFIGAPYKGMSPELFIVTVMIYIIASLFLGIVTFFHNFENIRAPYAKTSGLIPALQKLRDTMYYMVVAFIGVAVLAGFGYLTSNIIPGLTEFMKGALGLWTFVISALALYYYWVFRRWNREELSYTRINFKVFRDIPLMLLFVGSVTALFGLSSGAPNFYGDSDLLDKIYERDQKLYKRISSGNLHSNAVHQKSGTGMTALMAAAHLGDLNLFKALEASGAKRAGIVKYTKSRMINGNNILMLAIAGKNLEIVKMLTKSEDANSNNGQFSALHLASYHCSPEIVDHLLEKGAKINSLNSEGKTPLHIAARDNCLAVVVSLLESGSDPLIKDKFGKMAKDYIKSQYDRNKIGYYLEKKMRSPAGKK